MKQKNFKYYNLVSVILIFVAISFISVGYSALNSSLTISGEAAIIPPGSIYISNIELIESNEATELFNPTSTDTSTNIGMSVPSANSSFTYEITIRNTTSSYYYLNELNENMNSNGAFYQIFDLYLYTELEPNSDLVFQIKYDASEVPSNTDLILNLEYMFVKGERYKDPVLEGADPKLIDGLIPIVYDEVNKVWIKADVVNGKWYDYANQQWANATSVIAPQKMYYVEADPGTVVQMEHMTSMVVWIPRYSYTLRDTYGYHGYGADALSVETPGAFDIKFIGVDEIDTGTAKYTGAAPSNYYTPASFCWGNTCDDPATRSNSENEEIPGFWIAKFEASTSNNLFYSKPNVKPAANLTISQTFYRIQDLMNGTNGYENYGFVGYVDAHLIKNTEWGAIAYLSQSKYGKYGNIDYEGVNKEIYLNNCSTYITGIGGANAADGKTEATCSTNTYETYFGMGASTTGNIFGVYDMIGGTFDRVMGIILSPSGQFMPDSSGFTELPEGRYINIYPYDEYTTGDISPLKGDALTETIFYYSDRYLKDPRFSATNYNAYHWFYRGGSLFFTNTDANGIFSYTLFSGVSDPHHSSRFTITIY